ncbi:MAG: hypothetical protein ACR2RB_07775 [Gammaproteobacteria bacterium]
MNTDHTCEANYKRLLELIKGIDKPGFYSSGGDAQDVDDTEIRVSVIERDRRERATRIALEHRREDEHRAMRCDVAMEIRFYHDISLAVALSCRDPDGYRCAHSERGHVLSVSMSELNQGLGKWLT